MNNVLVSRILCTLLFSISFSSVLFLRKDPDRHPNHSRYLPEISGLILPLFLFACLFMAYVSEEKAITLHLLVSLCFTLFLHISLYFLILVPLLPLFRRFISARACYMLWLLPNYLYFTFHSFMALEQPLFVIHAPGSIVKLLFYIWLTGFILVTVWNLTSHLLFRRKILKSSKPIRDLTTLRCWGKELEHSRVKYQDYNLRYSPLIATPLSIGLFKRTICVFLPDKKYTEEELSLIFRHELVHISREDSWTKFYLMFCTAVCWFNPLMWYAMKKSAEDIELTCDEFVLQGSTEETRQRYASLILETAGNECGFTTCLSASAKTLRYRLKNIILFQKKYSGGITVGIISFLLFLSCGYVSLAYGTYTGEEKIYRNYDSSQYQIDEIVDFASQNHIYYQCMDSDALHQYLSSLTFGHMTGNYTYSGSERSYFISFHLPNGRFEWITLSDRTIEITAFEDEWKRDTYYLANPTDWDYLDSILMEHPSMEVQIKERDSYPNHRILPTLSKLYRGDIAKGDICYQSDIPKKNVNGIYGYDSRMLEHAVLTFSKEPIEPYLITIESWDKMTITQMTSTELAIPDRILLPDYPAYYMITTTFKDKDGIPYTAEFRFNIGSIE